ncbi:MAG TPA: T9SS type A sorting domain-containing protein, partial [Chitinophagales bacterium]|nr:T9SS type A sorting domain-containing protein [Chitinophagales bacterium]
CFGGSNGAASINTPTGGAGGFTYNWTPGNPTGDGTVSVTGLTAGTWTCTVTDANSCTATQTFNVTQPSTIVVTPASQTNISCFGGSNGAASINTPTGGAGGFTYNWTPGNPTGDGTVSVTGLTAGSWTCTVTDANACTATQTFTITQPTAIVVTPASQTNVSCFGGNNGAASINTPTGGAGGFTYNWTPGNPTGDGTVSVTGLTAGTWTCTVTDANACTASQTFTITQPTAISASASTTSTSCSGNDGAANLTASGGTPSYTYQWSNGAISEDISSLSAGTYIVTVTDANSCTATASATVASSDNVAPVANCQNITAYLNAAGVANVPAIDVNNGSTDACGIGSFSLSTSSFTCANVGANTVTLTVADVNGNSSTCSATITIADTIRPVANCRNITRYLNAAGTATITASQVNNGSSDACGIATLSVSTSSFTCANVGANTVTLTVTDNNGNISTCNATVTIEDTIRPVANCQNITRYLNAAGTVSITASQVNNGSSDACGIATLSVSPSSFTCANVGANTVTLTVTDNNGNTSTCNATVTIEDTIRPVANCQNITRYLNTAGTASVSAVQINNGSTDACGIASLSVSPASFTCANVGANTVTLTVTDNNGNTSSCNAIVTIEDTIRPVANCQNITSYLNAAGTATASAVQVNNGSSDACGIASLSLSNTSFTCANVGANTVTLTVADVNGNSSTCSATVTVADTIRPAANCQNVTRYLNAAGTASITASQINNGSSDACGIATLSVSPSSFTCANVGANTVTLTVTDNNGNVSTCNATVTIEDTIRPVANCQNITSYLNAAGTATASAVQVNNGSSDACGIASLSLSNTSFTCANVGANTVALTVTDNNGNTSTCSATVTIADTIRPVAICQNITTYLDASGNATVTAAQVNNGSTDACGIATLLLDVTAFDCNDVGANTVVLTVTDVNGNASACSATVTVVDTIAPVATCQNITVQLDANGTAAITAAQVDNGSADVCSNASLSVSPNSFTCANIGANTVTLTVTDVNGNTSTCNATVTVEDTIKPVATCQNITTYLDANGNAAVTALQVNNGSADACGIASLSLSNTSFTCANIGANTVTLTVADVNGNTSTCGATVTVVDTIAPVATCQSITTYLDANGNATITAAEVNNGSADACSIASLALDLTTFDCNDIGANTVVLTVTDVNGNISTCSATVTVLDTIAPVAVCQGITVQLDANGNATITAADIDNGSTDACGIATRVLDVTAFDCSDIGANTVVLTVTDVNGNASTCNATVTVADTIAPVAVCQNITVQLDATGNATIAATDIDNGSTDACGIATRALDITAFDCSDIGANTVVLTITDVNGNSSTCSAIVTVEDTVAPVVACQAITVHLDATGNASITAAQIDNGSTDACGSVTLSVTPNTFNCLSVGANTVTLTATDINGNSSVCTATVTVVDTVAPVTVCHDITVQLDANGNATITAADVTSPNSSDACGISASAIDVSAFNCSNVGANPVTLTLTDINGNTSSCIATVTVEDTTAPVAICQDITVQLDANGSVTISGAQVNNGSTDLCGVASVTVSPNTFDCNNIGANTVTLTVTDNSGNVSTCTSIVTVEDTVAPVAVCQNITVQLDATGNATITAADINNGSTDACGIATTSIDITDFDCSDVGTHTVTLTVTDINGNASTCSATVTVADTIAPVAACQGLTVQLDANGNATITAAQIENGSTDACGIAATSIDITSFDCSNLGANTVTLTVTDVNGNSSACTATVTVEDTTAPVASCRNITVQLDANGSVTVTGAQVDNGSTDLCGVASLAVSPNTFDCSSIGTNTVTLTVTDASGNTSTCTATVTVEDTTAPTAICQNISVALSAAGTASITASQINNGSTDACGIATVTVSPTDFTCANTGANNVTLTVTDVNGNTSTCTAVVTVTASGTAVGSTLNQTVCSGLAYNFNGQLLTASGTYYDTLATVNGCDSIITLNLIISVLNTSNISASICPTGFYNFYGEVLTDAGVYTDTVPSAGGCDTIVTLTLTETTVSSDATVNGNVCTATQAGASYQWYTCNTGQPIQGATSQSYTATQPGGYQCLVTLNGCPVSTICVYVNPNGVADIASYRFNLYPNPNTGAFTIQHDYTGETEVIIENMLGQRVKQFNMTSTTGYFDISDFAVGIYNVVIASGNERLAVIKVVKQ